jgi:hypothetical protein
MLRFPKVCFVFMKCWVYVCGKEPDCPDEFENLPSILHPGATVLL